MFYDMTLIICPMVTLVEVIYVKVSDRLKDWKNVKHSAFKILPLFTKESHLLENDQY